jgi:hypothetical protein
LSADIDVKRLFILGRPNGVARLQTSDNIKGLINYATIKALEEDRGHISMITSPSLYCHTAYNS